MKSLIKNSNHLKVAATSQMIMWPQQSTVNQSAVISLFEPEIIHHDRGIQGAIKVTSLNFDQSHNLAISTYDSNELERKIS